MQLAAFVVAIGCGGSFDRLLERPLKVELQKSQINQCPSIGRQLGADYSRLQQPEESGCRSLDAIANKRSVNSD